ncbi:phosphotransferase [Veronia nyctiphanis]|uniref:phosphotransferase n=1 Tax=Veronia nyctiphanis TaxID=1278244 RepID=UPI001376365E|nr:phosphotransferase [Veronia nyctiphanis]
MTNGNTLSHDEAAVVELLRPYLSIRDVQPLAGGLTNRCLKLTDEHGKHYVWRPQSRASDLFNIDRNREYECLTIASKHKLTSKPLINHEQGLLVEWIEGSQPTQLDVERLLKLLHRLHQLPLPRQQFHPAKQGRDYFSNLSPESERFSRLKCVHDQCQQINCMGTGQRVFCHFDFGLYNLIETPENGLQIIDFEYAAAGDPLLDIVFFCRANELDVMRVMNDYCELNNQREHEKWAGLVPNYELLSDYLSLLWFELGYQLYGLPIYEDNAKMILTELEGRLCMGKAAY